MRKLRLRGHTTTIRCGKCKASLAPQVAVAPVEFLEYSRGKFTCSKCLHADEVQGKKEAALEVARKSKKTKKRRLAVS